MTSVNFQLLVPFLFFAVLISLFFIVGHYAKKRRKSFLLSAAESLDERSGQVVQRFWDMSARLAGHFKGRAATFIVIPGGKNRPSEFRIKILCRAPLTFKVWREGGGDKILKALHLEKDVQVGDDELDQKFVFTCQEPERFASWARRSEVRQKLLSMMASRAVTRIELHGLTLDAICLNYISAHLGPEDVREMLQGLEPLAASLESAFGTSASPS